MLKDDRFGTNYFVELEIIVNFASTVPTTPLNDAYHGGTSVFIYALRQATHRFPGSDSIA